MEVDRGKTQVLEGGDMSSSVFFDVLPSDPSSSIYTYVGHSDLEEDDLVEGFINSSRTPQFNSSVKVPLHYSPHSPSVRI